MSLELGGGWSLKNAKGVQSQSWKDSEMFWEPKTGHPLTGAWGENAGAEGMNGTTHSAYMTWGAQWMEQGALFTLHEEIVLQG